MWQTSTGTRTLDGLEAEILRRGLEIAVDRIELRIHADDSWECGVALFDALTPHQQLALLAEVGQAIFDRSVPAPKLTAINEAALYVICQATLVAIDSEIDGERRYPVSTRQLISEFVRSRLTLNDGDDAFDLIVPEPDSLDAIAWEEAVDFIADQILEDHDFEIDALVSDNLPENAQRLKATLGIDEDYFTAIAPDPKDLSSIKLTLKRLVSGPG